jgi:hypothetical protein
MAAFTLSQCVASLVINPFQMLNNCSFRTFEVPRFPTFGCKAVECPAKGRVEQSITAGMPGLLCTSFSERNWSKRSWKWHEERSIVINHEKLTP